jgi:uncharacterized protein (TIGR03437 family)
MKYLLFAFICVNSRLIAFPLWFEPNQGQTHASVEFLAHSPSGFVYFDHNRMAVRDVRMDLIGTRSASQANLEERTGGISSYFIGRTEKDWHTGIPHYGRIRYKNVYAGIDLVYYGHDRNVEYDFILKPGADPDQIKLAYNKPVRVDANGDLLIEELRQHRPKVFQNGHQVGCDYLMRNGTVQLALAEYDHSQSLTVDPVLEFSTYLGGPAEEHGFAISLDTAGNVYLAGGTQSPAAPTLDPFQNTTALILSPVVFKFAPDGHRLIYYAVVGNNSWDSAYTIAVDSTGSPIISGQTRNPNFPLKNAFQTQFKAIWDNAFITKVSPDGKSILYSSYLGGNNRDSGNGIAVDAQGNVFVTGDTSSSDFPTLNALQAQPGGGGYDCFITKVAPTGILLWSTYFGSSGAEGCYDIAIDRSGNAWVAGSSSSQDLLLKNAIQATSTPRTSYRTPMLARVSTDGKLLYSSFVGGPTAGFAKAIAIDASGNIFLGGSADSQFVTKNAFQSQSAGPGNRYLMGLDPSAQTVRFASYFGGSGSDIIDRIAIDNAGSMYVIGWTSSADFPVKGSFQVFSGGGVCQCDAFVAKFAPGAQSLIYSTLLGGHNGDFGEGVAVDNSGNAYIVGTTLSQDFPTKSPYQATFGGGFDLFFAKISDSTPLAPSPLTPNPGRLSFRYTQGASSPPAQIVAVTGPAFTASPTAPWLNATVTPSTATVSVNPAGLAPGVYNGTVSLTPQAGTPTSLDVTFTVLSPAPVLTSVDPVLVPVGSSATTVTIHGSGFTKDSAVQLNGVPFTPVVFVDAKTLRISFPQSYLTVEYNHTVAVKNPTSDLSNVVSVSVGTPAPQISAITNAASFTTGPVAPGEIVTIFGTNLTDKVTFDNIPATLVYASAAQVSVTVPYAITGPSTMAQVASSAPVKLDVAPSAPGIFAAVPAGENVLVVYATGCGPLTMEDLPRCALPLLATVNGQPAIVLYAGIAPGLVQGANQINIQLAERLSSPLSIVLTAGDMSTKPFIVTLP